MWWWNVLIGVLLVGRDVHGLKGHLRKRLSGLCLAKAGLARWPEVHYDGTFKCVVKSSM